jgi:hypothetical protein
MLQCSTQIGVVLPPRHGYLNAHTLYVKAEYVYNFRHLFTCNQDQNADHATRKGA